MMSNVYVPQEPSRFDPTYNMWLPMVNLSHAEQFGKVIVMLPANVTAIMMTPIVTALKEKLATFCDDDYLVALGDPSLIAAASGIILRNHSRMNLLKWDKRAKKYSVVEIKL